MKPTLIPHVEFAKLEGRAETEVLAEIRSAKLTAINTSNIAGKPNWLVSIKNLTKEQDGSQ